MSLLIQNMDMPKDCWSCPMTKVDLITGQRYCGKTLTDIKDSFIRLSNCPLVEIPTPHGRLIDADVACKKYKDEDSLIAELAYRKIRNAPTVIEAEG